MPLLSEILDSNCGHTRNNKAARKKKSSSKNNNAKTDIDNCNNIKDYTEVTSDHKLFDSTRT